MREGKASTPFYRLCLLHTIWLAALIVYVQSPAILAGISLASVLSIVKVSFEIVFAFFLTATVLKCVEYAGSRGRDRRPRARDAAEPHPAPPLAVIYVCCGDLDAEALHSLARIETGGEVELFVHDDEGQGTPTAGVMAAVRRIERATGRVIPVFSRPQREGGKPGAVNHVLERIPDRFQLALLADSDSYAIDCGRLAAALELFRDPRVAGIQFRNTGVRLAGQGPVAGALARAIDVFDLFATHQARHGLMPFLGHNGVLRLESLRAVGGLTPGMLSDDIDVSIKLALRGQRIAYVRDVVFGETVPPTYQALRRRARKWAVGCTQVLRRHWRAVLRSRALSTGEKLGFVEFCGFYVLQVSLLIYLVLGYIALPLVAPSPELKPVAAFATGACVLLAILAPALMNGGVSGLGRCAFAWRCALAYGSLALATVHGVLEGMIRGGTEWVPTARAGEGPALSLGAMLEVSFGLLLFGVPLTYEPILLAMPSTYLFVMVYLAVPFVAAFYTSPAGGRVKRGWVLAGSASLVAGVVLTLFLSAEAKVAERTDPAGRPIRVTVHAGEILVDGRPFEVRGIHYSPYPPGSGPRNGGWPGEDLVKSDFVLLHDLGVNTILVHDAPSRILDRAAADGLMVIYTFTVDWQSLQDPGTFDTLQRHIAATVDEHGAHRALLYYLIGNEVPEWVVQQRGASWVQQRIEQLARTIKERNDSVLVSHANWPPTKDLQLPFLDVVSFNVYPAWPREVAVTGYGPYIEHVLRPIAGARPLVITEFGQNTLEASESRQAEVLRDCWSAIRRLTQGGVVFSFADEWWKNYDNPIAGAGYWEREYAPDDQKTQDLDPEEYYGILTASRQPKPAYYVVRQFLHDETGERFNAWRSWRLVFLVFLAAVLIYTVWVFWPEHHQGGTASMERSC